MKWLFKVVTIEDRIRVLTRTGKPGKWEGISQSGKKVREFLSDLKSPGKSHKILENSGNCRLLFLSDI